MGKLADLREQRENMSYDDPNRIHIEEEINKIEQWCIDSGKGFVTKLTTWTNEYGGECELYPHHTAFVDVRDIWMVGELNGKGISYNSDKSIHHCQKCPNI